MRLTEEAMEERERGKDTAGGVRDNCMETRTSQKSRGRSRVGRSLEGLGVQLGSLALVRTTRSSGVLMGVSTFPLSEPCRLRAVSETKLGP